MNNKKVKSYFLFEIITSIKNSLKKLKEYAINISPKIQDSFFYIDNDIIKINRIIQNIFFEFKLKLAAIIYKNLNYNIDTLSIKEKDINQNEKFSEEEILFIESFKKTGNYNNFFINFIENFESTEELYIPFLFFDEFTNLIVNNINRYQILSNIDYFQLIDNLYISDNTGNIVINFDKFIEEYDSIKFKKIFKEYGNNRKNQLISLDNDLIKNIIMNKS